ncbi:MAG: diaminopimelate epimerase [Ignavibacteria bacterium]|nr:diaminopimelate epimerase [Ignavibacteria bacterium]
MEYQKYSGAGNDFIIINNLEDNIKNHSELTVELCSKEKHRFDGVIFLEHSNFADFKMNYFNRDGTGNALCGNGLRCTVQYIADNNLTNKKILLIEAVSKIFKAEIIDNNLIAVQFPPPKQIKLNFKLRVQFKEWWQMINASYVDVGSPHGIVFIDDIEKPIVKNISEVDIENWGRNIRMHQEFMPEGVNAQFVQILSKEKNEIALRSFERGVEAETLACGTGALSSAIVCYLTRGLFPPIKIHTASQNILTVNFEVVNSNIKNLTLTGPAIRIED